MSKFTAKTSLRSNRTLGARKMVGAHFGREGPAVNDALEDWAAEVKTSKSDLVRQIVLHALKDAGYDI